MKSTGQAFGKGCAVEKNMNKLEATAGQVESCVSSVVCDVGHGDNLQELGPWYGTNHTFLAQESDELEEPGGEGQ